MAAQPGQTIAPPLLCLLSEDPPPALGERLRQAASARHDLTIIDERRATDRRARVGLREEAAALIRLPVSGTGFRPDRRKAERRMELRAAPPPRELRELALEYPGTMRFAHRLATPVTDAKAAELIHRVQAGDTAALDELYRLYLAPLYGYMVVTLRDHHAAEDAAHEVFLRVLRALPRYEFRGIPFRVWLFRIARNHLLNLMTRARPEDAEDPSVVHGKLDRDSAEDRETDLSDLSDDEFLRLIQILPLSQRQVLVLRYVFDMSFAEIGAVLEMNAAAARNQQRRAFAALRPRLLARRRTGGSPMNLAMSAIRREPRVMVGRRDALRGGCRMPWDVGVAGHR